MVESGWLQLIYTHIYYSHTLVGFLPVPQGGIFNIVSCGLYTGRDFPYLVASHVNVS